MTPRPLSLIAVLSVALVIILASTANAGSEYKVLHSFGSRSDGTTPYGPAVLDKNGNVYGVTFDGGTGQCSDYGCGTVFELKHQANGTWAEEVLHNFAGGSDGAFPDGRVTFDVAGNLFGTLNGDVGVDVGGVFELSLGSAGWTNTVLYADNAGPGLVLDKAGNIYGGLGPGNYFHIGAIGELARGSDGWTYTDLFNFNPKVGYAPPAPPIWDGKGNLFGATRDGGISQPKCVTASGCGVIFEMTPNGDGTWTYHILHRFASFPDDGQSPSGGLVMDASGNLYGVTGGLGGAHKNGTVFKFTPSTGGRWKQTVLYDFPNCANGCYPFGTLAFDKAGNLYGAGDGGAADCQGYTCGVIFKLTPQAGGKWTYSVLHKFNGADGAFPWGVILDDKGNIFGTTENGGKYNLGVAFELTP